MRQFIIAALLIFLAFRVAANDQLNHIMANAEDYDQIDDNLYDNDITTTTMKMTTTTTMTKTTTNSTKTTLKDIARAVKKVKEAIEETGLSPAEISGIALSLLTFLVTCALGCLKVMAHLRAGGNLMDFLAQVFEAALIKLRRRQQMDQEAIEEAAGPPSSVSIPVGRETEV